MSNLCHQIISEFLHTVITYEHELELLRRQLAENENFDIFYSFQSIDKFGNGALDSNDIKSVYDVHGIKIKKEEIEFLNKKGDTPLNITYKEFMNLLLSASSVSLREKCLAKGGSKSKPSQENDRLVEDKILELFNKKIEYAKALQVFSTYDVSPIDLRDSLFECCEESRGFLEHRKLEALMKKHNYTFDKSDFATIKRLASTFLETKISPAQFVAFMLPQADVISLTNHGIYPAAEHRHSQRSHTQETFRNNHMTHIQQDIARKSSTPQPELRYSHLNVDLTSPTSNNRPSVFPSLEPENAERAAFYAERPHLIERLGVHASPNFKGTRKTVKFSVDEEDRYNNFEESVNTRPSFGSGLQSINSNGRNQPELLIKDNPLSINDLPSTDNRQTAGSHIFESHVKAAPHNKENAVRHVRESHYGRNSQKSPPRSSHETPYSAKSQQIKDQVILREANKIKSQYDDKLAGKRELLNLSKQKRADSSVVITNQKSPNKSHKRGIVEGVSVVDSVYFDPNRTMNISARNGNYTMSSKYDNSHNRKNSVSPDQKYATFESGWKLTDYTGGGNKHGKMPSLEVARFNSQNDGLTELRNLANADENGQKVIDDAYLNRLHYILDRKNAERDAHALKVERTVSFQPAAQSPYFEPNYQQDRNGDYRDYTGRRDISGFIQEIGRNSPTRRDSPTRSNSKNFTQFRDSPKRDLRLNNEISVMSDINTLENLKIGSYRFGNNFYDRMLP